MATIEYDIERKDMSFTIKVTGSVTPYYPATYEDPPEGGELEIEDVVVLPGEVAPPEWGEWDLTNEEVESIRVAIYEIEETEAKAEGGDYDPVADCGCDPGSYCAACYGGGQW